MPNGATAEKKRKKTDYDRGVRWTLSNAAREFGIHRELMERQRRALHIEPGEDERFSTRQVAAMIYGDKQLADAKRAAADAEAAERRNQRESGELIPTSLVISLGEPIFIYIRQIICGSSMSDGEKDDALAALHRGGEIDWTKAAHDSLK